MTAIRASPGQRQALEALAECGSLKEAARALGISVNAMERRLSEARARNKASTPQLMYRLGIEAQGDPTT